MYSFPSFFTVPLTLYGWLLFLLTQWILLLNLCKTYLLNSLQLTPKVSSRDWVVLPLISANKMVFLQM